jgi:hypothetical protein
MMVKGTFGKGQFVKDVIQTGVVIAFFIKDFKAFSTQAVHGLSSFEGHLHKIWV